MKKVLIGAVIALLIMASLAAPVAATCPARWNWTNLTCIRTGNWLDMVSNLTQGDQKQSTYLDLALTNKITGRYLKKYGVSSGFLGTVGGNASGYGGVTLQTGADYTPTCTLASDCPPGQSCMDNQCTGGTQIGGGGVYFYTTGADKASSVLVANFTGDTDSPSLNMMQHAITNLPAPSGASDATNKSYVDTAISTVISTVEAWVTGQGYLTTIPSNYVKNSSTTGAGNLTIFDTSTNVIKDSLYTPAAIISAVESWVTGQGYLTTIPSNYVKNSSTTGAGNLTIFDTSTNVIKDSLYTPEGLKGGGSTSPYALYSALFGSEGMIPRWNSTVGWLNSSGIKILPNNNIVIDSFNGGEIGVSDNSSSLVLHGGNTTGSTGGKIELSGKNFNNDIRFYVTDPYTGADSGSIRIRAGVAPGSVEINMNKYQITSLDTGTTGSNAANKSYVDAAAPSVTNARFAYSNKTILTSGTGAPGATFLLNSTTHYIFIEIVSGGGGGGGASNVAAAFGAGGGSGGHILVWLAVTPGMLLHYNVMTTAAPGGTTSGTTGQAGYATNITNVTAGWYVNCSGGLPGTGQIGTTTVATVLGGAGGSCTSLGIPISQLVWGMNQSGTNGVRQSATFGIPSIGAPSPFSPGARAAVIAPATATTGVNCKGYGGGGSGGDTTTTTGAAGGTGCPGMIIVTEYS